MEGFQVKKHRHKETGVSLTPILVAVPDSPYVLVFLQFKLEFLDECNMSKSTLFETMRNLYVVPDRV